MKFVVTTIERSIFKKIKGREKGETNCFFKAAKADENV